MDLLQFVIEQDESENEELINFEEFDNEKSQKQNLDRWKILLKS